LNAPTIDESKIEMDYREKQIDVSGDPNRMFFDHSGPFYDAGTEFTFILPFTGDAAFFDVNPQNFTYSLSGLAKGCFELRRKSLLQPKLR